MAIPHEFAATANHVTVSIGIAFAEATESVSQLIQNADTALYTAKEAGRNQMSIFEDTAKS